MARAKRVLSPAWGCLGAAAALMAAALPALAAPAAPFQLWPAVNGATPTAYVKEAPPLLPTARPWRFAPGALVDVSVDAATILRPVTPYQFGCNAAWWAGKGWFLDPDRIDKAKQAGLRFWRWPGGSSSDNYHWDGDYRRHGLDHEGKPTANMNGDWAVNSADFISFCRQTGSEAIVTVNYAAARYADQAFAEGLAARWVRYFNQQQGFKVHYWEVGNEGFGPWEEGNTVPGLPQLTGAEYARGMRGIADAMRRADPDICIGAVGLDVDADDGWTGYHGWMRGLLSQLQGRADFLILHQYFSWPFDSHKDYVDPSDQALFDGLKKVPDGKAAMDGMAAKYGAPALPVALTEFNILNASAPPCVQLVNGLFTAAVLGESLKAGFVAADYWDWKNGWDEKMKGDNALLSNRDPAVPDGTPRPAYYAYALFERAFGDHLVEASSGDPSLRVYASRFAGGQLGLVLVNQDGQARTARLHLAGASLRGRLMGWVLTGQDLRGPQVSWNGVDGMEGGGGPYPFDGIPPYGTAFDPAKALPLPLPPRSAVGLVLY